MNSCVIYCLFRSKLFPIAVRFCAEILSPYGRFPSQSGILEFIFHRKQRISVFLSISTLLLHPVFWDIFLMRPTFPIPQCQQSVCLPSKISPAITAWPMKLPCNDFLSELMDSRFVCFGVWEIFHLCAEWKNWSFE